MITSQQIRAARALLGLSEEKLAAIAEIDRQALTQAESDTEEQDFAVTQSLESVLIRHGINFIEDGENGHGAGVRFARSNEERGSIRPENLNSANDG